MPDVSVVVPTYNRAASIVASVRSLFLDTDVEVEVLVVDDGSTDDTVLRLRALDDARVRVVERPHAGIAATRTAGVQVAAGRYLAFHDSDDQALPGRLRRPVTLLDSRTDVDFVIQNGRMLGAGPSGSDEPWVAPAAAAQLTDEILGVAEVFRWNLGQLQGACFRRATLEAVGPLDDSLQILDDLDLVLRVAVRHRGLFIDEPAFAYRPSTDSVSRDRQVIHEEAVRVAEKLVREHPEALAAIGPRTFRRRQARRYARLADVSRRRGDAAGARDAMAMACRLRPFDLRLRLRALRWLVGG